MSKRMTHGPGMNSLCPPSNASVRGPMPQPLQAAHEQLLPRAAPRHLPLHHPPRALAKIHDAPGQRGRGNSVADG